MGRMEEKKERREEHVKRVRKMKRRARKETTPTISLRRQKLTLEYTKKGV